MKEKYIKAYMKMAIEFGQTSEAIRKKVGALIVKPEGGIVAEGCNGMPPGWETEECEHKKHYNIKTYDIRDENQPELSDEEGVYRLVTKKECRHAEVAALEKLWASPCTSKGCYLFVSLSPCIDCAIKIKTAGITRMYYNEQYRDTAGIDFLQKAGILVEKIALEDTQ